MDKQRLIHQLFVGKVADILGFDKASELLKEATKALESFDDVVSTSCGSFIVEPSTSSATKCICGREKREHNA